MSAYAPRMLDLETALNGFTRQLAAATQGRTCW
jgi:hypothetical protein